MTAARALRIIARAVPSFGAAVCPSLTILTSVYAGAATGALLASASGAWSSDDPRRIKGQPDGLAFDAEERTRTSTSFRTPDP